jgi:hypothetical protein
VWPHTLSVTVGLFSWFNLIAPPVQYLFDQPFPFTWEILVLFLALFLLSLVPACLLCLSLSIIHSSLTFSLRHSLLSPINHSFSLLCSFFFPSGSYFVWAGHLFRCILKDRIFSLSLRHINL